MIIIYLLTIENINTYSPAYDTVMGLGFKQYSLKISSKGFLNLTETNRSGE